LSKNKKLLQSVEVGKEKVWVFETNGRSSKEKKIMGSELRYKQLLQMVEVVKEKNDY